jgi:hypothetical protein
MESSVAFPAQCDEIIFSIIAKLTSIFDVVNFQSSDRDARLAAPPVSLKHRLP